MEKIRIKPKAFEFYTGQYIGLKGNSVHETIESPDIYKKMDLPGEWVMGVTEPVRVLPFQYDYVSSNENELVLELPF